MKPTRQLKDLKVVFIYLNFAARNNPNNKISHIGLGNAAAATSRTLKDNGIEAEVWPVAIPEDIEERLEQEIAEGKKKPTHIIISAPWVPIKFLAHMCKKHNEINYITLSHSVPAFLAADRGGISLLRQGVVLEKNVDNYYIAGNSQKFSNWASLAYGVEVPFLPNLYYIGDMKLEDHRHHNNGVLKIGSFGAIRPLKNQITAAATAVEIGKRLGRHTEFWLNSGRNEGGGFGLNAIEQLVGRIEGFQLKLLPWEIWERFRDQVGKMDLLIQPSDTESFCMVVADGMWKGVPSVVSNAIEWTPKNWQEGIIDDPSSLADVGISLLKNRKQEAKNGQKALKKYVRDGIIEWKKFLLK